MSATVAAPEPARAPARDGWLGRLELGFRPGAGRTDMVRRRHVGPFVVQSALYPEGAPCHAILLHPPGGLVGGDRLELDLDCAAGAHALVTTPAAGKVYRSAGPQTRVRQDLRVAAGATLEFLPAECIVFDGARCFVDTHFHLQTGATLLAWDAWVMGRPASGEDFARGIARIGLELAVDARPLLVERSRIAGSSAWLRSAWGIRGHPCFATLVGFPAGEHALERSRRATDTEGCEAAVTLVDGVLVARAMAPGLIALRAQLQCWWQVLRPILTGCDASPPRIWST